MICVVCITYNKIMILLILMFYHNIANILEITYQSGGSDRCWSGSHCFIWIRSRIGTQILLVSLISFGLLKNKNNFFLKFFSFYITYGTGTWLMLLTYCLRITTGGRTNFNFNIKLLDKFLLRIREKKGSDQSQCFGSASVFMRIRIQDPKNVHMAPDPDPSFFIRIRIQGG